MANASIHLYCVDGTNIVRGGYGYGGPAFREQEDADAERLVEALDQLCARLGSRVEIDLYFDGAFRAARKSSPNLRLRFTRETQADELIVDSVRARSYLGGGSVTVVTGDGELGRRAAEEGGRWLKIGPGSSLESVIAAIERRWSR
jgi:hypothetical protein